jgi:hypothetical protein
VKLWQRQWSKPTAMAAKQLKFSGLLLRKENEPTTEIYAPAAASCKRERHPKFFLEV